MEDIQFTVGDRVHATTSEGVSLVSGETYKIAKIVISGQFSSLNFSEG